MNPENKNQNNDEGLSIDYQISKNTQNSSREAESFAPEYEDFDLEKLLTRAPKQADKQPAGGADRLPDDRFVIVNNPAPAENENADDELITDFSFAGSAAEQNDGFISSFSDYANTAEKNDSTFDDAQLDNLIESYYDTGAPAEKNSYDTQSADHRLEKAEKKEPAGIMGRFMKRIERGDDDPDPVAESGDIPGYSEKDGYGEPDDYDGFADGYQEKPAKPKSSVKQRLSSLRLPGINHGGIEHHDHDHHDHHEHDHHDHDHSENNSEIFKYAFIASIVLFVLSFFKFISAHEIVFNLLLSVATILAALPIFFTAVKNASKANIDENVLMTISVIAACLLGEFREAAAVAIFFRFGEMMEDYASRRSKDSIRSLSEIQVDTVNILTESNTVETVRAEDVEIGSSIVIYPHERFPLDCVITGGSAYVDASAITGESIPVAVDAGDTVYSGTVNGAGTLSAKTVRTLEESTASRIIKMVEEAAEKKSKTQKLISRIASYYTPAVVILALIIAIIPSIVTKDWATWINRSLVLLVASCPCALVLSIPLGFYTSMGTAARNGILVKGSKYIEQTAKATCVAFDKTGTLTTDELTVDEVISPSGLDTQIILLLAAIAESRSNHPAAKAIRAAAPEFDAGTAITNEQEYPGMGTCVDFAGKQITCGSKKLLESKGIFTGSEEGIFVAVDNDVIGIIIVRAAVREDVEETIKSLRDSGIGHIAMLTGDNEESAGQIARSIDIDEYHSKLMPEDKLNKVEELKQLYGKVIYVGDGINDAPVLAAADVGIGMGLGSHAANEAADIVLTNNNLSKLALAKKLAVKTMNVLKINILSIMAIKLIVIILGICGIAPMWLAVFADVGLCIIAVIISSTIAYDNINDIIRSLFKKK